MKRLNRLSSNDMTEEKWNEYIAVQKSGAFNMFDPRAREMTCLTKDEWLYIMENYGELSDKFTAHTVD